MMKRTVNIVRAIAYVLLSTALLYAVSVLLIASPQLLRMEPDWLFAKWAGLTLLFIFLGTLPFGFLALLISRVNPFAGSGRYLIAPFLLGVAALFYHRLHAYFFESYWLTATERSPAIMGCLAVAFAYMAVKLCLMLGHDRHNVRA